MAQQKYFIIFLIDLINYSICYNKTILETSAFKSNKNCIVLLYGSSASLIAINGVFTLVFVGSILLNSEPMSVHQFLLLLLQVNSWYTELSAHTIYCSVVHDIMGSYNPNFTTLLSKVQKGQISGFCEPSVNLFPITIFTFNPCYNFVASSIRVCLFYLFIGLYIQ